MNIPFYHSQIARSPLAAGMDAAIYGLIRQSMKTPGFFMNQAKHIYHSAKSHRNPVNFLGHLFPEYSPEQREYFFIEGLKVSRTLDRFDRGGAASDFDGALIYAAAQLGDPDVIIETGTGMGGTTYAALQGCEARAYTFDREEGVADLDGVPYARWRELPMQGVGRLIPEEMEERVVFVLADIKRTLPCWVADRKPMKSLVILDSLHTPEHQAYEIKTLKPILAPGSVVLCDDTTSAWSEWAGFLNCGLMGGIRT